MISSFLMLLTRLSSMTRLVVFALTVLPRGLAKTSPHTTATFPFTGKTDASCWRWPELRTTVSGIGVTTMLGVPISNDYVAPMTSPVQPFQYEIINLVAATSAFNQSFSAACGDQVEIVHQPASGGNANVRLGLPANMNPETAECCVNQALGYYYEGWFNEARASSEFSIRTQKDLSTHAHLCPQWNQCPTTLAIPNSHVTMNAGPWTAFVTTTNSRGVLTIETVPPGITPKKN